MTIRHALAILGLVVAGLVAGLSAGYMLGVSQNRTVTNCDGYARELALCRGGMTE
jgi:hypothetical protein